MYYKLILSTFIFSAIISAADIEVKTSSGISSSYSNSGILNWDDIPYAKPPIGNLRWKAPREITYSENLLLPKDDNFCVQRPSGMGGSEGEGYFSGTEDCLYLDIKAPKNSSEKQLPVMFWIHGGGNTSGLKDLYDFSKMVKRHDVIVVSINYRLGPFGWFTHPAIQGLQSGLDKTSNFGTLDIIEALKWVQSNISLFGGDPNNVTIFGESAGGHNVFSLLVSKEAKGLFHKAISQSGYTTTIQTDLAFKQDAYSPTSNYASFNIVDKVLQKNAVKINQSSLDQKELRKILLDLSAKDFFSHYAKRPSYEDIPLMTADGVVIPVMGLRKALASKEHLNIVPTIAGSNRDEVKLWLGSAEYFVDLKFSPIGKLLGIPKVFLKDEDAFEIFNRYRSSAWKLRGVDGPLRSMKEAGNEILFAYRYDWDDHRRFVVGDFKKLIGAAHATEIPLLTGNNKLVGDYGFLIYPRGPSKRFTSKNMMKFWANFAREGAPGKSTNSIKWNAYNDPDKSNFIILDNRANLNMSSDMISFKSLVSDLDKETDVTDLEKCVVLLQMLTFVGDDLYDKYINSYPGNCIRSESEKFLKDNASFIDY
ncbi:carboxylesterase family protein [Gammaproteobacteria bacterium]|nr:carboxylesterase family protein [Gammaproteobacteria bacterium]